MKSLRIPFFCFALLLLGGQCMAQGNLEIDTPAIAVIRTAMKDRHAQLEPLYASGAVGLTRDGRVELRDPASVPLSARATAASLVAAENSDRAALYREIARANGHPEWEPEVRSTFGARWIERAQSGWYVQTAQGQWMRK